MSPFRRQGKKATRFLEDITFTSVESAGQEGHPFLSPELFMGRYTAHQLMGMLDRAGMVDILRKRGYSNLLVHVIREDGYTSRFYVNHDTQEPATRLIELVVREGVFRPTQTFIPSYDFSSGLPMLLIEWMALQDPRASFTPERPRLPGQQYPGLGGLKNMQAILYELGRETGKEAIVDVPAFFHAAAIYARLYTEIYARKYAFFSPVDAGILQAILRDVCREPYTLADVSFAIAFECLLDARTGECVEWKSSEQIYPISQRLQRYIEDDRYKEIVQRTTAEHSYAMDWERYERMKEEGALDAL